MPEIFEKSKNPPVGEYMGREYADLSNGISSPSKYPDFEIDELYQKIREL